VKYDPRLLDKPNYPVVRVLETMFSDMDIHKHVNNVAIARFFEEGRAALQRAIRKQCPGEFAEVVLAGFEVHYLREVSYPGPVEVAIGTGRVGTSSFDSVAALFQNGECAALSWATDTRRNAGHTASQPLTGREREALAAVTVNGAIGGSAAAPRRSAGRRELAG
jgi:acyl-CoA thioester hydrolase